MEPDRQIVFGPFRLDLTPGRLWRGERKIGLRTRTRAVLGYLVTHPGRVIPREELARHAWAGTHVSKTTLRGCVWEIRQALGDQATTPQYIETVGQQGYRFLAETGPGRPEMFSPVSHGTALSSPPAPFVGRQLELARLQDWLAQAQGGVRQLVFVTGEAGVGKTPWCSSFSTVCLPPAPCGWGRGSASNRGGRANRIYLYSKPWGA